MILLLSFSLLLQNTFRHKNNMVQLLFALDLHTTELSGTQDKSCTQQPPLNPPLLHTILVRKLVNTNSSLQRFICKVSYLPFDFLGRQIRQMKEIVCCDERWCDKAWWWKRWGVMDEVVQHGCVENQMYWYGKWLCQVMEMDFLRVCRVVEFQWWWQIFVPIQRPMLASSHWAWIIQHVIQGMIHLTNAQVYTQTRWYSVIEQIDYPDASSCARLHIDFWVLYFSIEIG